ncbi:hypothetical protein Anas_04763 [Armadillidium nasatum]|uniref:Uncharacterized protein n=1 Tax=Armadillidium nasatum TaxID=96803 RepID=A0A5N5SXR3_9CRUS|nr:hypothetical protein Anas_04763 [Armadillidium nasatum]
MRNVKTLEPEKSLKNSDYDSLDDDDDDDDDVQPLLKKARQESPKLSSILLGDTKKSSYLKLDNSASKSKYSIPNCTKVSQMKKKVKKTNNGNVSSTPVSILPKGLNSCVSIVNIPNPHQSTGSISSSNSEFSVNGNDMNASGSINLGGGITISPQKTSSFSASLSSEKSHTRQMPNLKKMLPVKIEKKGSLNNNNLKFSPSEFCLFSEMIFHPATVMRDLLWKRDFCFRDWNSVVKNMLYE